MHERAILPPIIRELSEKIHVPVRERLVSRGCKSKPNRSIVALPERIDAFRYVYDVAAIIVAVVNQSLLRTVGVWFYNDLCTCLLVNAPLNAVTLKPQTSQI